MMFCQKCGSNIADGAKFCLNCGTPVANGVPEQNQYQSQQYTDPNQYSVPEQNQYQSQQYTDPNQYSVPEQNQYQNQQYGGQQYGGQQFANQQYGGQQYANYGGNGYNIQNQPVPGKKKLSKGALIGIIAGAAVVVIAVIVALLLIFAGGKGYKTPEKLIEAYFSYAEDEKYDKISKMLLPQEIDFIKDEFGARDAEEIVEAIDNWYPDCYGETVRKWEITDEDYYDRDDLTDLLDLLDMKFNKSYDYVDYEVDVNFRGGEEHYYDFDLIQVKGKWYLVQVW